MLELDQRNARKIIQRFYPMLAQESWTGNGKHPLVQQGIAFRVRPFSQPELDFEVETALLEFRQFVDADQMDADIRVSIVELANSRHQPQGGRGDIDTQRYIAVDGVPRQIGNRLLNGAECIQSAVVELRTCRRKRHVGAVA